MTVLVWSQLTDIADLVIWFVFHIKNVFYRIMDAMERADKVTPFDGDFSIFTRFIR